MGTMKRICSLSSTDMLTFGYKPHWCGVRHAGGSGGTHVKYIYCLALAARALQMALDGIHQQQVYARHARFQGKARGGSAPEFHRAWPLQCAHVPFS